ncbi:probable ubiquitin carboxyl-terminal hydrolase creB [Seriola lalandi dorsalis]|uniref:probable ubiquitin carboxyl-terminal hydrolase creB n=1 Tax=Seriola lalandi dorsalis TaxID=1841481 RepID=UPI000C6F4A5F|nr:probable ubiquitin carboxyl-terminal hydrolase creB [Seriola lalandi dorsalis]
MDVLQNVRQFFNPTRPPPAEIKYHGLKKKGATCYLNSVLQVLFMTKGFREAVERYTSGNPDPERIDSHLKDVFDVLKKKTACTYNIIKRLGIDRVYEQQDAAEYFEKILALTSDEASQLFHGELTHKTICSKCLTEKNADGLFWHLPLELVVSYNGHYSVMAGTEEYFRDSNFSGENQMYCDQCDDKSDATVKCVIKHHPEVLMLLLKRFEFNYHYKMYFKNNCVVDVPRTLQIPENQTYELYAVVDHVGGLRGGHYTATVKSEDDERWYNFNDARVSLPDYQLLQVDNNEMSRSAYLLFYRKKTTHTADTCAQDKKEVPTSGGFPFDNHDQGHDAEMTGESEESVEVGNDTAVDVMVDDETGIRDTVSVVSGGVNLSADSICKVEDQANGADVRQIIPPDNYQWLNEEKSELRNQDVHTKEQEEDEEGGKTEKSPTNSPSMDIDYQDNERLGKEEEMETDVKDDKEGKTGADKLTPGGRKLLTLYDLCHYVPQKNGRAGDSKENMPEDDQGCKQGGSDGLYKGQEQQGEERRDVKGDKEQRRADDDPAQSKGTEEDSERREKLTENQGVESVEMTRLGGSQPRETTGLKEVRVEGRGWWKPSRIYGKIIEEEVRETPDGPQRCHETKTIRIETVETSKESGKSQVNSEASADRTTWRESVCTSKLSDSPLPEPQTHRHTSVVVNAQEENETNSFIYSNAKATRKVPDAQMQKYAVKKRAAREKRRRWWHTTAPLKKHRKRKRRNRTKRLHAGFCKSQKNQDLTSESDKG